MVRGDSLILIFRVPSLAKEQGAAPWEPLSRNLQANALDLILPYQDFPLFFYIFLDFSGL